MSFWSSQRIEAEQGKTPIVEPFNADRIQQGAYELSLSDDALITPDKESCFQQAIDLMRPSFERSPEDGSLRRVNPMALTIPPGQFALVYTKEKVTIPANIICFISVKAKIKLKGLVNVSGFHVDPGYSGRLKFSLYNAGNKPICLTFGEPCFLIWFATLDAATRDPYDNKHYHSKQNGITAEDREQMSEASTSPAALDQRLKHLEQRINIFMAFTAAVMVAVFIPILIGVINILMQRWFAAPDKHEQQNTYQYQTNTTGAAQNKP
jgi:dCTP deaminase